MSDPAWADAVARGGRVVIRAGSHRIADRWRHEQGLSPRQVIYASQPRVLCGLRDFAVVNLCGWASHRYAEEMTAILALASRHSARSNLEEGDWDTLREAAGHVATMARGLRGQAFIRSFIEHSADACTPDTSTPYFLDIIARIDDATEDR